MSPYCFEFISKHIESRDDLYDWFYSKLKESDDAGSKLSSQVIDLEMQLKNALNELETWKELDVERSKNSMALFNMVKERDQEIANHKATVSLMLDSDSEADLVNKVHDLKNEITAYEVTLGNLQNQVKAADEVVRYANIYDNGEDVDLRDALEHYKLLKQ